VLATLALARVVSQNKNFGRNPSWSYVKPVVTRGSTVYNLGTNGNVGDVQEGKINRLQRLEA
jgi:hypothetical protein